MSNTSEAASRPYPTLEETVACLFEAANRLPKDVVQTEYTPRNEVIFYDFVDGRMTTSPTFGRTVYVEIRNRTRRFDKLEREAALKHLKSRIKTNSAEITERVLSGMTSYDLKHDFRFVRSGDVFTTDNLLKGAESTPLRTFNSFGTAMAFRGYIHPDAITDLQIDEFIINWPNYRELAAAGNVLFQQVCSVPTIVARIEDRMKSIHTRLVNEVLPRCLWLSPTKSELIHEFHDKLISELFSKDEIMAAVANIDMDEVSEMDPLLDTANPILRVDKFLSMAGGDIDHDGVRRWVRSALVKARRYSQFDRLRADHCGTHTAKLLRAAKRLGVDDYAVEVDPLAEYDNWHPSTWGATLAIRLTKAIESDPSITPIQVVEDLLAELDTAEVDYYVDEDGKAFVEDQGLGEQFPRIHQAKTYALGNSVNEGLSIVRLT